MNLLSSKCDERSYPDLSLALSTNESHRRLSGMGLSKPPMKKSKSMIDLNIYPSSSDIHSLSLYLSRPPFDDHNYHSNDSIPKKKLIVLVAWTKNEHMRFLEGL
ncbi:hypothetical protein QJS10_CPA03g01254 [Acorus calamus]|uniref:Uncharacterized protein n=1 Tax=Acorus calamus TaxID=4465 RepID=A0AAV9F8R2_ACOCL|nr:hypothetical protein QJS10_CPA03g01254 [Acorus calamus]